jgi:TonB family protein
MLILVSCSADKQEGPAEQTTQDPEKLELVVKDAPPKLAKFFPAPYPPGARADSAEGIVKVKIRVLTDGTVGEAIVVQKVHPLCDATALSAAQRCRFLPAREDGEFVESWLTLKYPFKLK